jgi:predicted  nucleic acid-binding Zn-ribbon protein
MSNVYQSVRGVVQGTLHRRKPHLVVSARVKDRDGSLNDGIQELEKILVDRIGKLKTTVSDDQAVVASEVQHAEQTIEGLKANITALEARLLETEDTVHRKEVASQKMEENLSTEIRDLQSVVKKKEEDLEIRQSEINDLKSKIDVLIEQVTQLGLAIRQAKGEAASEAKHAEQVIEGLKANITALEARSRETEDIAHRKEAAAQKMQESLSTEIRDLQSVVKKKEEALESRDSEVNQLKSKTDVLTGQVSQLELTIGQAKGKAASEAQHAEQVIEGLKIKIATLQTQLSQAEQIVGGLIADPRLLRSDSTIKALDQNRNNPSTDLNSELEPQTNGSKDSKAEAVVDTQAQANGAVVAGEQLKTGDEKPISLHREAAAITPIATEAVREIVSQEAFDFMIAEFAERSNVMESIASLIVRDHVRAIGESMEEFPQRRLIELLESLSRTISDEQLKTDFCQRFATM